MSTTEAIFAQERFGVFFNIVDVLDVTTNTAVSEYLQFDCSQRLVRGNLLRPALA